MFFSCDKFALLDECRSERIQYELVAGQDAQSCAKFLDGFVQATFPDQSQAIFVVSLRIRGGGLRGDMSRKATAQPNEDHDELHCNGAHDQSRLPAESYHRPRLPPGVTQGRFRERFRSNPDLPPIWSLAHIPAQHLRVVPCAGSMYPTLPEPALISILQRGSRHRSVRRTSENRTGNRIYSPFQQFMRPFPLCAIGRTHWTKRLASCAERRQASRGVALPLRRSDSRRYAPLSDLLPSSPTSPPSGGIASEGRDKLGAPRRMSASTVGGGSILPDRSAEIRRDILFPPLRQIRRTCMRLLRNIPALAVLLLTLMYAPTALGQAVSGTITENSLVRVDRKRSRSPAENSVHDHECRHVRWPWRRTRVARMLSDCWPATSTRTCTAPGNYNAPGHRIDARFQRSRIQENVPPSPGQDQDGMLRLTARFSKIGAVTEQVRSSRRGSADCSRATKTDVELVHPRRASCRLCPSRSGTDLMHQRLQHW